MSDERFKPKLNYNNPYLDLLVGNTSTSTKEKQEQPVSKSYYSIDPSMAMYGTAGMSFLAQALEHPDKDTTRINQERGTSDATYSTYTPAAARGDWEMNTGMFRPDQHVAVQFQGTPQATYYGQPVMAKGGELHQYDMGGILPDQLDMPILTGPDLGSYSAKAPTLPTRDNPSAGYDEARATNDAPVQMSFQLPENMPLDPDVALAAIGGHEGGKVGMRTKITGEGGKKASASGTYQMVNGTVKGVWQKHFRDDYPDYSEFRKLYDTNASVEYQTAKAHIGDLIQQYGSYALGAWYSPQHAERAAHGDQSALNEIPGKSWGNKQTFGAYLNNVMGRYKKAASKMEEGGEYELSDEEINALKAQGYEFEIL